MFSNLFSIISPYANTDKNIANTKTNIVNKMFILFDDSDQIKLFSNKGEYEANYFESRNNTIQFIEYRKSILGQDNSQNLAKEFTEGKNRMKSQESEKFRSENFDGTGSQEDIRRSHN